MNHVIKLFIVIFALSSCKVNKSESVSTASADQKVIEDYAVLFISKGSGIDVEAYRNYKGFIEAYNPPPIYKNISWGKEGEKGFCFDFSKWEQSAIETFKVESSKKVAGNEMVQIGTSSHCD